MALWLEIDQMFERDQTIEFRLQPSRGTPEQGLPGLRVWRVEQPGSRTRRGGWAPGASREAHPQREQAGPGCLRVRAGGRSVSARRSDSSASRSDDTLPVASPHWHAPGLSASAAPLFTGLWWSTFTGTVLFVTAHAF